MLQNAIAETNQILGAIGVSGASSDEDEYLAIRGVINSGVGEFVKTEPADPAIA